MSSNYICKRGYVIHKNTLQPEELTQLRSDLTVTPRVSSDYGPPPESFPCFLESENKIHIPIHYGIARYGPAPDRRAEPIHIHLRFAQELRDNQIDPVQQTMRILQDGQGCILAAYPSFGKTVSAYYLISQLHVKTLILVHKEFLLNQWIERARAAFPDGCSIGKIQGDKFDIEGRDVVIATIQSISMKNYDIHAFDSFGLVIIDECHHISSKVFSRCLYKTASRYMLGLSGTPDRADGLLKVFQWHISDRMICPPRPALQIADDNGIRAEVIQYHSAVLRYCRVELNYRGKPSVTQLITQVTEYRPRTNIILQKIQQILESDPRRQVLVLSERRKHLVDIFDLVREQTGHISAYYLGGMKQRDLDQSTRNRVILATMSMAQEALDIPSLNTMILATSKGNVVQAIGRVLRRIDPECMPWIIDMADVFSVFRNQMMRRIKYYKQMKFHIQTFHTGDDGIIHGRNTEPEPEPSGSDPESGPESDPDPGSEEAAAAAADPFADDF